MDLYILSNKITFWVQIVTTDNRMSYNSLLWNSWEYTWFINFISHWSISFSL